MAHLGDILKNQRNLDNYWDKHHELLADRARPKKGWIRSIRDALGMTSDQLGRRVMAAQNRKSSDEGQKGISGNSILVLERNEAKGSITLDSLERVAEGLDCDLFYTLVPRSSLQTMFDEQVQKKQDEVLDQTKSTMGLEDQNYDSILFKRHQFGEELVKGNAIWD